MPLEVRAVTADELDALLVVGERGFGAPPARADAPRSWAEGELDRTRVAFDGDAIVGSSRAYSFDLTLPGGASIPAAAVSWVAVLPTHRRQGVLSRMIAALHDDAREREEPVSMLTASEGVIYGRYGYGVATWRLGLTAERSRIEFADDAPEMGRMRMLDRDEGQKVLPALYERMQPARAGMVSRPDFWWPSVFWGDFAPKDKAVFTAVHTDDAGNDDGYVAYEMAGEWNGGLPNRRLVIFDMQAATGDAHVALWRYVFGVDLVGTVAATNQPIDDPLRHVVTDGRRVRVDFVNDGLWIAPFDSARMLAARRYTITGRLVIEVRAPDGTAQVLALDGGEDGAECKPTSERPDIVCTSAMLGACSLGGNRWSELAAAGRIEAASPEVLARADAMFLATPAPALLSYF